MVIVQAITTIWTKASRGAPGATLRAATPESFDLPTAVAVNDVLVHSVVCLESDEFKPAAACWDQVEDLSERKSSALERGVGWAVAGGLPVILRGIRVDRDGDQVSVERLSEVLPGWPTREQGRILVVKPSTWSRVIWNRRHAGGANAGHGEWTYAKVVLNVANGLGDNPTLFSTSQPSRTVDQSASLA